ncbi:RNA polymerase sigma factor SigW [Tenacibaculum sp. 190130A14a]|uniref:RNA polymerase sigma-70 factor, ECF subfamily n=1 Tax=Tenacibaculum polynesiense TaxID=3137857 RepID=A0ABP1F409_9FLAO
MFARKKSDIYLIKKFLSKKDVSAFGELYDRYTDRVYAKCLRFFQDENRAKDATQDIFIKILYELHSIKETEYFSSWLYTVTYRYCIDEYRKEKKNFFKDSDIPLKVYYEEDENVFNNFYSEILEKGLEKLNIEERTIIMMKYIDEMNIRTISEILGIGESAVKMRLKRTREKLINICNILINKEY